MFANLRCSQLIKLLFLSLSMLLAGCSVIASRDTDSPTPQPPTVPVSGDDVAVAHPPDVSPQTSETQNTADDGASATLGSARLGDEVALRALALVGKPYRYGGADLDGFDCSGLVYFIYQQLNVEVPRTAQDQHREAARVPRQDLEPGDLVFFRLRARGAISHVGIYVGENRFVHAPQSGKRIELRALDDHYFASRWVGAGRLN